jgi:hypothetical protein
MSEPICAIESLLGSPQNNVEASRNGTILRFRLAFSILISERNAQSPKKLLPGSSKREVIPHLKALHVGLDMLPRVLQALLVDRLDVRGCQPQPDLLARPEIKPGFQMVSAGFRGV